MPPADQQLLQQFVRDRSQAAFGQLVERHSRWLYSVCLRRLGDQTLAEDATQAVFLALAQRAPSLLNQNTISPWLHQAARFCALKLLRARTRRRRYESEAAIMRSAQLASPRTSTWAAIEADLEPALDRLGAQDRATIVLRFYEQRSHPEMAAMLGISLEASQKRLSRALQRLRTALMRKGTADSAGLSAIALGDLLARHGVGAAPGSLSASVATAKSAAAGPTIKAILFSMKLAKLKATAVAAAVVLAATVLPALVALRAWDASPVLAQASQPATASADTLVSSPATQPLSAPSVFKIPNALFVGRCRADEFLIGIDPQTKRTPESDPAGYVKSQLQKFLLTDQRAGMRAYKAPYTDLRGKRVRLSAWVKMRNVEQWGGLAILVFGKDDRQVLDRDMSNRPISGTTDWAQYSVVVDVPADATAIAPITQLWGKGEMWTDDVQLEAVGPDVALTDPDPWQKFSFYSPSYAAAVDPQVQHNGHAAVCIASVSNAARGQWVRYLREELDVERYRGTHLRITIWMKSAAVTGGTGIGVNVFGPNGMVANEGQQGHRPLRGTTDWKEYTAVVEVPQEATELDWGVVMNGAGKLWVDVDSAKCVVDDTQGL